MDYLLQRWGKLVCSPCLIMFGALNIATLLKVPAQHAGGIQPYQSGKLTVAITPGFQKFRFNPKRLAAMPKLLAGPQLYYLHGRLGNTLVRVVTRKSMRLILWSPFIKNSQPPMQFPKKSPNHELCIWWYGVFNVPFVQIDIPASFFSKRLKIQAP